MPEIKAAITGISCWLPEDRLTNADLEKIVDTSNEWIIERTGIRERRILRDPDKGASYLAVQAAKLLFEKKNIDPLSIDLIILATATPDHLFPSTASIVANQIGAKNAWGFDLLGACSGFLYALNTGKQFIESGAHKRVLVIGADKMSTITDYSDRRTCILFGDAAGAALLEPDTSGMGIYDARMYMDGSNTQYLKQVAGGSLRPASEETVRLKQHYLTMEGHTVFDSAVSKMVSVTKEIMERNKLENDDIRFLVPHQANKRIIDSITEKLGMNAEKVMMNIQKYGNTTTATLPICLTEWENELKRGDTILLTTFGAGFSWGGMYLKWAY